MSDVARRSGAVHWAHMVALALVLLLAGYLRLAGADWGEFQFQHPDENHTSSVLAQLRARECADDSVPVDACAPENRRWIGPATYLDTTASPLNPYNHGFSSYVYGNLPLTLVRMAADVAEPANLTLFARQTAAVADLVAVLFLYLLVARLYGSRLALLASLFSALSVMQIQQSHFFTVDLFVNVFALPALFCAVAIGVTRDAADEARATTGGRMLALSLGFGVAYGMAMASKLSIYPLAFVLPAAFLLRHVTRQRADASSDAPAREWVRVAVCLAAAAVAAMVSFRVCQPYAFSGAALNPQWVAGIREHLALAAGESDVPWNLQWARRSWLFSIENLARWGVGLPLAITAAAGFVLMGWRIVKGERQHLLLWVWVAAFVTWQSSQFNPTMRYQLPAYPLVAMLAAWFIGQTATWGRGVATMLGTTVVGLTAVWAFAFHGIYLHEEPRVAATRWILQNVPGAANIQIRTTDGGTYNQPLAVPASRSAETSEPYVFRFTAARDGVMVGALLPHVSAERRTTSAGLQLAATLSAQPDPSPEQVVARGATVVLPGATGDARGDTARIAFETPVSVSRGAQYALTISTAGGMFTLTGASFANETDFDYNLPFRVDGYDPFGGIYRGDLNLQVYWDDNAEKIERFVTTLDQADYIFIPTNHQYGQITRLPERYPLTTRYYQELVGCPPGREIAWCYREATPGRFRERLGFELAAVFENHPRLGPIVIRDQTAEEAFTFYDHPKVLIFRKTHAFRADHVRAVLERVDLSRAVRLTPRQFERFSDLRLSAEDLATQRAGGTWGELFDYQAVQNRHPAVAAVAWYLFVSVLGLCVYPAVRLAWPGLADRGYPLSRAVGLLVLGYLAWIAASVGLSYSRVVIASIVAAIVIAGALLARHQRAELREAWRSHWRYVLTIEALVLACFVAGLLVRLGNPDLWHPARGGERPMDFAYLNAVIRSTTFPPYDPWFAGGYINYYYFGFVLVGTPVKLLGIVPAIAYNLILPTLFALVAAGAFSFGWNVQALDRRAPRWRLIGGLATAGLAVLLGNLGTLRLLARTWRGAEVHAGEWYWNPSRIVPPNGGNEITEFPLFTFLYGDLHAHMMALPLAWIALSWALAVVAGQARWTHPASAVLAFVLGGLAIGALYPTNMADAYTYLPIALAAIGYAVWRSTAGPNAARLWRIAGAGVALTLLASWLYQPYRRAYGQNYSAIDPWLGPFTPIGSYLLHWGVPLFLIVCWMAWETATGTRAAREDHRERRTTRVWISGAVGVLAVALLVLGWRGVTIGWIALPVAAWAALLFARPATSDAKRVVLFLVATALVLTMLVEVVVVRGDIGRQNTIFKFYLHAWMLLAASGAAALAWTLKACAAWTRWPRVIWTTATIALVGSGGLFAVTAVPDKIRDRWHRDAPHTLDGMTFMRDVRHEDFGRPLDLGEDYRAIRWVQDHVQGSPVLVEAHCSEYRWCSRFSVYTGLPGVVGWNFHQRQQRALLTERVLERVAAIGEFYDTTDVGQALAFLARHDVRYIVVGQLERAQYPAEGIAKFDDRDGRDWRTVYRDGETVIYEVLR